MSRPIPSVEALVGEELSTVAFVRDYVEFGFDGPVLRALAEPVLHVATARIVFPGPGSRDSLCALIGHAVRAATVQEDVAITLSFEDGSTLEIPLSGPVPGGEYAHFIPWPAGVAGMQVF